MSADRTTPPQRVPILTEVVLLGDPEAVDIPIEPPPPAVHVEPAANSPLSHDMEERAEERLEELAEEQLVERVWADLQRQVDLMLEYRVRETLAPILTRATEAVVRESRQQLASTLRDVVARAVAQELARHRGR
jgi:diketogulonate reductase-like aldo/keto reductase